MKEELIRQVTEAIEAALRAREGSGSCCCAPTADAGTCEPPRAQDATPPRPRVVCVCIA